MTKERQQFIKCSKCGEMIDPSSDFSKWTRKQKELKSEIGYRFSDIDGIWFIEYGKYHTEKQNWMILECKTYSIGRFEWYKRGLSWQLRGLNHLDKHIVDEYYYGFHLIQFEKTSPEDGKIFLDEREISKDNFIKFLKFELNEEWYKSYKS